METDKWVIRITHLRGVLEVCDAVRERSKNSSISSEKILYSRSLFNKGLLHGHSLVSLLENAIKDRDLADIAGMCAISRCLIEVHNAFCYLTEKGIGKPEKEFRLAVLSLNHSTDAIRIGDALGNNGNTPYADLNLTILDWAKGKLRVNEIFKNLEGKQQKHLLRGRSPYSSLEYMGDRPVRKEIESAVYNLFSHNAHSYALGLHGAFGGRDTPAGQFNQVFLAVEFGLIYLSHIAIRYWNLRFNAIRKLTKQEKEILETGSSIKNFLNWQIQFAQP